jgi:hypothetical protein
MKAGGGDGGLTERDADLVDVAHDVTRGVDAEDGGLLIDVGHHVSLVIQLQVEVPDGVQVDVTAERAIQDGEWVLAAILKSDTAAGII